MTDYTPVIVYRVNDQDFSIDGQPSQERKFEVGARVTVAYEPRLPSSASVAATDDTTSVDRWMGLVLFFVAALIATIVSAVVRN